MTAQKRLEDLGCLTEAMESMIAHCVRPKREDVESYCEEVRRVRLYLIAEGIDKDMANLTVAPYGGAARKYLTISDTGELADDVKCRGCGDVPCRCELED